MQKLIYSDVLSYDFKVTLYTDEVERSYMRSASKQHKPHALNSETEETINYLQKVVPKCDDVVRLIMIEDTFREFLFPISDLRRDIESLVGAVMTVGVLIKPTVFFYGMSTITIKLDIRHDECDIYVYVKSLELDAVRQFGYKLNAINMLLDPNRLYKTYTPYQYSHFSFKNKLPIYVNNRSKIEKIIAEVEGTLELTKQNVHGYSVALELQNYYL
jgi:hypothetical protein